MRPVGPGVFAVRPVMESWPASEPVVCTECGRPGAGCSSPVKGSWDGVHLSVNIGFP